MRIVGYKDCCNEHESIDSCYKSIRDSIAIFVFLFRVLV